MYKPKVNFCSTEDKPHAEPCPPRALPGPLTRSLSLSFPPDSFPCLFHTHCTVHGTGHCPRLPRTSLGPSSPRT